MPHSTAPGPHPQTSAPPPQATAHDGSSAPPPLPPRVNRAFSISQCRELVTVEGPASAITLAAVMQQTYQLQWSELSHRLQANLQADFPEDKLRFTSFVGINLLRRFCSLNAEDEGEDSFDHLDLHKIGIPGQLAASLTVLPSLEEAESQANSPRITASASVLPSISSARTRKASRTPGTRGCPRLVKPRKLRTPAARRRVHSRGLSVRPTELRLPT